MSEKRGAEVRRLKAKVVCEMPFCNECDKELVHSADDGKSINIGYSYKCPDCGVIFRSAIPYPNFVAMRGEG